MLDRREHDADERADDPGDLRGRRAVAGRDPEDDRDDRGDAGDRRDDAHRADLPCRGSRRTSPSVPPSAAAIANRTAQPAGPSPRIATAIAIASSAADLRPEEDAQRAERAADQRADEVGDAPREARAEREQERRSIDPAGRCDRVELVRVVQHGRLGGAGGARVVVHGDAVEELCELRLR